MSLSRITYSTPAKVFDPVIPYMGMELAWPIHQLAVSCLQQTPVLSALFHYNFKVIEPYYRSVGKLNMGETRKGSCALIHPRLVITACHNLNGKDLKTCSVTFGHLTTDTQTRIGKTYRIVGVVEYDADLDYAILLLEGRPGDEFGFVSIDPLENDGVIPAYQTASSGATILLHHPLGKPLQLSVHERVSSALASVWWNTFHDSDYGSSGGAYFDARGKMTALHLGAAKDRMNFNLERLALPLEEIMLKNPQSVLTACANGIRFCVEVYPYIPVQSYTCDFIDRELYERAKFKEGGDYLLREPTNETPGVLIDSHQAKHSRWPQPYKGGRGSFFTELSLDQVIDLAELLVKKNADKFKEKPSKVPSMWIWELDKATAKAYKVKAIGVESAYIADRNTWSVHFYPK